MGITFEEASKYNLIKKETLRILPSKCGCGAPVELSDSLRELYCTDRNCKYNLTFRIVEFCEKLSIPISNDIANRLVTKYNLISTYQMMQIGQINDLSLRNTKMGIAGIKDKTFTLSEIAKLSCIDDIEYIADKIFSGFSSFEEFFDELDRSQVTFLNARLGIYGNATSLSVQVLTELNSLREELIFGEAVLKIKPIDKNIIRVVFSDSSEPFMNRSEAIEYLNSQYNSYDFELFSQVNESTDILIMNSDSNNEKYRDAKIINDDYVEKLMNNEEIEYDEIGSFKDKSFKPVGSKIYIDSLTNIINRFNEIA